jgi:hypothetical protein
MNSDLEDAIVNALRAKAGTAPTPAMPPLGSAARAPRGRLVLVAAAAVVVVAVAVGAVLFTVNPRNNDAPAAQPTSPPVATSEPGLAPGEVYYSLRLTDLGAGGVIRERQLWRPQERTGEWRQAIAQGTVIEGGRVVPGGGEVGVRDGGACYPAFETTAESCTAPPSWTNPTADFLAAAPRDPATIGQQLHVEAAAAVEGAGESGEDLVRLLELRTIGELLADNAVPADLSSALRQVVAAIPGVSVTEDMANLVGERGTGYSLAHPRGGSLAVIFDADDRYLGSPKEAVRHGVAPGLGEPPSRMFD